MQGTGIVQMTPPCPKDTGALRWQAVWCTARVAVNRVKITSRKLFFYTNKSISYVIYRFSLRSQKRLLFPLFRIEYKYMLK